MEEKHHVVLGSSNAINTAICQKQESDFEKYSVRTKYIKSSPDHIAPMYGDLPEVKHIPSI